MFGMIGDMAEQVVTAVEVPLERLEAQICEGAAHLAAGVGRWLLLVGEFDRRKGYERWECRSTAFWLNWHCGISVRTAQDQVRVGRALLDYPRIAEALCSGRLSYSKVRAITRVVTPETEATLIDLASERLGGRAIAANDEFFAPKENLLKPGRGEFIPDKFTERAGSAIVCGAAIVIVGLTLSEITVTTVWAAAVSSESLAVSVKV